VNEFGQTTTLYCTITERLLAALRAIVANELGTFNIRTNADSPLVRSLVGNMLQLLACESEDANGDT
jgi:hypothetical protein